jgi:molybdopterin synthase sulfur carrier subunit
MIRVQIPAHLRSLAGVGREVELDVVSPVTPGSIVDALEAAYPALRGTIRDHTTHKRRAMVRFFACERDISHEPASTPVPESVANGSEPFLIIGAISGG